VGEAEWQGIDHGHGHLQGRRAEVRVNGRRAAGRAAAGTLWLPARSGAVAATAMGEDGPEGAGPAVPESPGSGPEAA
jgi:hypothetical protein